MSPTNENMRTSRVASSRGYGAGCCLVDAPGIVQICRNHSRCSAAEIRLSTRAAGDRTDAESLQTPGPSLCDRPQHPSELLDIVGRIAAVQHRVTVWADRDQIGFRVHEIRCSHSVQRTLVVDVNEALARFAVPLLETQVAYRASQTMMIDAGVTPLGVPLVAIHRHSLNIPFLVDILLAQLADCCWLIRWGQARKGWAGKRWQSALGFVTLFFREQVPKACIQCQVLNTEVCTACLCHPIKSRAWGSGCEELPGIRKASVPPHCGEETAGPVADRITGPAIEALHFNVEVGFRRHFSAPCVSSARPKVIPLPSGAYANQQRYWLSPEAASMTKPRAAVLSAGRGRVRSRIS